MSEIVLSGIWEREMIRSYYTYTYDENGKREMTGHTVFASAVKQFMKDAGTCIGVNLEDGNGRNDQYDLLEHRRGYFCRPSDRARRHLDMIDDEDRNVILALEKNLDGRVAITG